MSQRCVTFWQNKSIKTHKLINASGRVFVCISVLFVVVCTLYCSLFASKRSQQLNVQHCTEGIQGHGDNIKYISIYSQVMLCNSLVENWNFPVSRPKHDSHVCLTFHGQQKKLYSLRTYSEVNANWRVNMFPEIYRCFWLWLFFFFFVLLTSVKVI